MTLPDFRMSDESLPAPQSKQIDPNEVDQGSRGLRYFDQTNRRSNELLLIRLGVNQFKTKPWKPGPSVAACERRDIDYQGLSSVAGYPEMVTNSVVEMGVIKPA